MYGVLYDNLYNENIGTAVKKGQYRQGWEPHNLQPMRLVGGSMRMIGGTQILTNPEDNVYRPRGAVYATNVPNAYIVPYSIVSYPQFNALELADVDLLKSGNHLPLSGGKIRIPKNVKKGLKKVGKVLKPVGKQILKVGSEIASEVGQELLNTGKDIAKQKLKDYLQGEMYGSGECEECELEGGVKPNLKKVGKVLKKTFVSKPAKKVYKGLLDVVEPGIALGISSYTGVPLPVSQIGVDALTNVAKKRIGDGVVKKRGRPRKVAGVGVYEGGATSGGANDSIEEKSGGAKSGGAKSGGVDKRKVRGMLIKKLMKEKGMSLPEASKHIKQNKLI
jgi:hypothetical protein